MGKAAVEIMMLALLFIPAVCIGFAKAGIDIPRDNCHWLSAADYNTKLHCGGNEVAIGACSGGGGFGHKDCPGGTVHMLHCCAVPQYSWGHCEPYTSDFGEGIDCNDHGDGLVLEASCHSGAHHDCHGKANEVECCDATLEGQRVGTTDSCTWLYGGHGEQLECGREDEVLAGRCGSGRNNDCHGGHSSQGNLCCEFDLLP